jgi:hypothetical protein
MEGARVTGRGGRENAPAGTDPENLDIDDLIQNTR